MLLCVAKSSDYFRERTFYIIFSLILSLVGMLMLAAMNVTRHKGVAYFACFLMAAGSYIPSCLVHVWHNNNDVHESSRAANTGFFVSLGNLVGVLSADTFRTEYAPKLIFLFRYMKLLANMKLGIFRLWWLPAVAMSSASLAYYG